MKQKAILLNQSRHWFDQVSELVRAIGKTKKALLRQNINRDIAFVRQYELPLVQKLEDEFDSILRSRWLDLQFRKAIKAFR